MLGFNDVPLSQKFLLISFSPSSIPLKQRSHNNGLSADFIADNKITFFPKNEDITTTSNKQAEIKSAVSYIANELLEAIKFNGRCTAAAVKYRVALILRSRSIAS